MAIFFLLPIVPIVIWGYTTFSNTVVLCFPDTYGAAQEKYRRQQSRGVHQPEAQLF
jgi:hypothetical protein